MSDLRAGCGFLSSADLETAIAGTLPAERRTELDRHVESGCHECALLAADLDVFAGVVAGGALEGERQESDRQAEMLRARLRREVARKRQASPIRTAAPLGRWGLLLAAASVLAVLFWQVLREPGRPDALRISLPGGGTYVAAVKVFDPPPVLRGERNLEELWRDARDAYTRGRYAKAEGLLARIAGERPDEFDARVYRGICLLALGRLAEARATFAEARDLARAQDLSTTSLAWYEALAALQGGDVAGARLALEEAASGSDPEAERARELLPRLP